MLFTLLDSCVSSLRRGRADLQGSLLCIFPMFRRLENMVGVDMVLAEYHQIQTWLLEIYLLFAI